MARNRFQDAWEIQDGGACNIKAIARVLVKAADEAASEEVQPSDDAAVRLIVHQLAYLTNQDNVNHGFEDNGKDVWSSLMDFCERNKTGNFSSIYDVCNDYSLDPVEKPFKFDEYTMSPHRSGYILRHKENGEIHYFIGPDGMKGRQLP